MEEERMNMKAFYTLSLSMLMAFMGLSVVSPLMAIYAKSMGASGTWLGFFYSSFPVSRIAVMPLAGWVSDRMGRKPVMIVGLIVYGIVTVLYNVAQNIYELTAVRFIHGFASGMLVPTASAYIGDICPKGKEATYMGRFQMMEFIGSATGPLVGGALATIWSIDSVFYVMTGAILFVFLLVVFLVPSIAPQRKHIKTKAPSMWVMLKDSKVKAISLYMASRAIFRQSITAFLPLIVVETLGMSTATAGFIVSIYLFAGALGQGLLGPMADKYNRKLIMIASSFIGPLPVFFLHEMRSPAGFLAILIPIALINSVSRASAAAYSVEAGKKFVGMGSVSGIVFGAQSIATFLGPQISGYTMDHYGATSVYLPVATIGILSAFFVAYWLLKKEPMVESVAQPTSSN